MGLLLELVLQVFFEFVGEALVEAGWHGARWVVRRWTGRTVVLGLIGLGSGWAWGSYLNEAGRVTVPRTFWASIVIAGAGLALLFWRLTRPRWTDSDAVLAPPWRWPLRRIVGYVILSLMVAAGVWFGFSPWPLG